MSRLTFETKVTNSRYASSNSIKNDDFRDWFLSNVPATPYALGSYGMAGKEEFNSMGQESFEVGVPGKAESTLCLSSIPVFQKGSLLGGTVIFSPVLGFLPS